jgi:RNA polymerase sigma-70 factor (ECF subfamily)
MSASTLAVRFLSAAFPREGVERGGDAALVARARDGEADAVDALFRRHARAVTALVVRLSGARADAEDIAQEAFATALDDLPSLRDPALFRPWLLRIAVRQVHRYFRKRRLRRWLGLDQPVEEVTLASLAAPDLSPEQRAELGRIDAVLRAMPDAERIAWTLRHVEGESLDDAAVACGCSLATVKRRIAAAQTRLDAYARREGETP